MASNETEKACPRHLGATVADEDTGYSVCLAEGCQWDNSPAPEAQEPAGEPFAWFIEYYNEELKSWLPSLPRPIVQSADEVKSISEDPPLKYRTTPLYLHPTPASTQERDAMELAASTMEWALDLIDLYDKRLLNLGEPRRLVYSAVHMQGKVCGRRAIKKVRALLTTPDTQEGEHE